MSADKQPDPRDVPDEFAYVREVLKKYTLTDGGTFDEYKMLISDLSSQQLIEIAGAYQEIVRREDTQRLSTWLKGREDEYDAAREKRRDIEQARLERIVNGEDLPPDETEPPKVRGLELFKLFEALAREGISPFDSREVAYSAPKIPLDWNKLPQELRYLSEPAIRYGGMPFREVRDKFARSMKPRERDKLKMLAERIRSSGDDTRLMKWWQDYPINKHSEASLTYWLMALINELVPEKASHNTKGGYN